MGGRNPEDQLWAMRHFVLFDQTVVLGLTARNTQRAVPAAYQPKPGRCRRSLVKCKLPETAVVARTATLGDLTRQAGLDLRHTSDTQCSLSARESSY